MHSGTFTKRVSWKRCIPFSVNDRNFTYGRPLIVEEDIRFVQKNIWKQAWNYRLVSKINGWDIILVFEWPLWDLIATLWYTECKNKTIPLCSKVQTRRCQTIYSHVDTNDLKQNDILYRDYVVLMKLLTGQWDSLY